MWYLQFQLVCDKLFMSFTLNDLPLLVCAVGRPHSYYSKGSFYFAIIDISLFLNHSPSEWFSEHKNPGTIRFRDSVCRETYITKRSFALPFINSQKAATCAWLFAPIKGQVCAEGVHAAPCKNSKKWPKPLFRYAQAAGSRPPLLCSV